MVLCYKYLKGHLSKNVKFNEIIKIKLFFTENQNRKALKKKY